jgi:serine/threonine protein kinase
MEVSAIRVSLQQQDQEVRAATPGAAAAAASGPAPLGREVSTASSWSVDEHPLSMSRYQREFEQMGLLASGAFGKVYSAVSKMDGRVYAIKKVPFSAVGYDRDSVQHVVREVHCLAVCDHPHVVRYYTSWLEPSWMTGSSGTGAADHAEHLKMLNDLEQLVAGNEKASEAISDDLKSYFKDPSFGKKSRQLRRRSGSMGELFDGSGHSLVDEEISEWTVDNSVRDDTFLEEFHRQQNQVALLLDEEEDDLFDRGSDWSRQKQRRPSPPRASRRPERPSYRYEICLFIQMQLCHPATLADWIRQRNQTMPEQSVADRLETAAEIFRQLADGLSHVHRKGCIHRDLKPAVSRFTVGCRSI